MKAGQKASNKDYDGAIKDLLAIRENAATLSGKFQATVALASWYAAKKDHANSLKYYQEAYELSDNKNVDIILGVASEAEATGDKQLAKSFYQKAIDYYTTLAKDDTSYKNLVDTLNNKIKQLEK